MDIAGPRPVTHTEDDLEQTREPGNGFAMTHVRFDGGYRAAPIRGRSLFGKEIEKRVLHGAKLNRVGQVRAVRARLNQTDALGRDAGALDDAADQIAEPIERGQGQ